MIVVYVLKEVLNMNIIVIYIVMVIALERHF